MSALDWLCMFGVATFGIALLELWESVDLAAGLFSAFFIIYVLFNAHKSHKAKKSEDSDSISNTIELATRCEESFKIMRSEMEKFDYRVYFALVQMTALLTLFSTRYWKYLEPDARSAVREAESVVMSVQMSRLPDFQKSIRPLGVFLPRISAGVRHIDHPSLRDSRIRA